MHRIAFAPADDPAVLQPARRALAAVAEIEFVAAPTGSDAVLAVHPQPALARAAGHDAELLAVRPLPPLVGASPLREERIARVDLLLVRGSGERVARVALAAAERRSGRLAAVHSAGGDPAWRSTIDRIAAEYEDVTVEPLLDAEAASALVAAPSRFDVLACEGPAGEALAGVAAAITGTAHLLPGGSVGPRPPAIFWPSPAAGAGSGATANPLPSLLAAAMLLREGLGLEAEAERLEVAVELALETGLRTPDLLLGAVGERRAGSEALAAAVLSGLGRG